MIAIDHPQWLTLSTAPTLSAAVREWSENIARKGGGGGGHGGGGGGMECDTECSSIVEGVSQLSLWMFNR